MSQCSPSLTFAIPIKCIRFHHLHKTLSQDLSLKYSPRSLMSPHSYVDCFSKTYTNSIQYYLDNCHSVLDILYSQLIDVLTSPSLYYSESQSHHHYRLLPQSYYTLIYCTLQILWFFTNGKIVVILH